MEALPNQNRGSLISVSECVSQQSNQPMEVGRWWHGSGRFLNEASNYRQNIREIPVYHFPSRRHRHIPGV